MPSKKLTKRLFKQEGEHTYYLPIRYGLMNQQGEEIEQGILVLEQTKKRLNLKIFKMSPFLLGCVVFQPLLN
jgi:hypothetical protein